MMSNSDTQGGVLPSITEEDIKEVETRLRLVFDESRREILRSNGSFYVQACPGSGKTTLLVAKLALLAKKWPHYRRGICVLSHTNVARQEIKEKLSGTAGERLLAYPHFVGTIHSFVNEFFALPLLRSEGRLVRTVDNEACGNFCQRLLSTNTEFATARSFLRISEKKSPSKTINNLIYEGRDLELSSAVGKLPCGASAPSFAALLKIKSAAAEAGLWRLEDMFAFAERLLATRPEVAKFARWRFPAVFVDEMQDTSELQIRVMARLFPASECSLRQRFGDSNQAIFDRGQSRARTGAFPCSEIRGITNSQRFGQAIATLVHPLAPDPPKPHLIGEGPPRTHFSKMVNESLPHTVFLFGVNSVQRVLPAFAQLLIGAFPTEIRLSAQFLARAIGFVGKSDGETGEQRTNAPRSLRDYWPTYEPRIAKPEPRPEMLADFIQLAQLQCAATGDRAQAIATAVRGIAQLVQLVDPTADTRSARALRGLRDLLASGLPASLTLKDLLWRWCVEVVPLSEADWRPQLYELRKALTPIIGDLKSDEARAFCAWSTDFAGPMDSETPGSRGAPRNRYQFPETATTPDVAIDIGTIHGAKGQTHTATLVLETFFKSHDLGSALDWLTGDKHGAGKKTGSQHLDRLRLIYTAMTRPTHLLCLAMRENAIEGKRDRDATIKALQNRGWQVKFL